MNTPENPPAFPTQNPVIHQPGMLLRDYFATKAATDELREITFRNLSRAAQEKLTGMKHPEKPMDRCTREQTVAYQIEVAEFDLAVSAALRFRFADAMLSARKPQPQPTGDE